LAAKGMSNYDKVLERTEDIAVWKIQQHGLEHKVIGMQWDMKSPELKVFFLSVKLTTY